MSKVKEGAFQTPKTISDILNMVSTNELVLPAIQRDFVWPAHKIVKLFDSIMKGFPISSFLFWNVRAKAVGDYKFYYFLRQYRESFRTHGDECGPLASNRSHFAVLDGQQRITALWIGFCGSYAWHEWGRLWGEDSEYTRPTRHLYLNISNKLEEEDNEDAMEYQFAFLTSQESNQRADYFLDKDNVCWFRVGKILDIDTDDFYDFFDDLAEKLDLPNPKLSRSILSRLLAITHKGIINYYQVDDDDLHKALHIFIRINSSGVALKISDIILSIAISYWKGDAKKAFDDLISHVIHKQEYSIDHENILKTFLVLHSNEISFKATSFKRETALTLEECWNDLAESIKATFDLITDFGYSANTLKSYNALIPITYYIYWKRIWGSVKTAAAFVHDREKMAQWLHIVNISGAFGRSTDTVLRSCRRVLKLALEQGSGFPAQSILRELGVSFSDESIEELLNLQKDNRKAFPVLALLFPHLEYRYHDFHKDHMHAAAAVAAYKDEANPQGEDNQFYQDPAWWNSIRNLQLLDANENQSKQDKSLLDWIKCEEEEHHKDRGILMQRCYIPTNVDLGISNLKEFLLARGELLRQALKEKLTMPEE